MQALAQYRGTVTTEARAFDVAMFSQFVEWIDRPEKTTRTYITNLRQFAAWLAFSGITAPDRSDIINYREWLLVEHDAIIYDRAGWNYRRDANGDPIRIVCKPNTAAQYLRSVCQFFKWAATEGIYPDIAANIHAPKIRHNVHRKEALTPREVVEIEHSILRHAEEKRTFAQEVRKDTAGRMQRSTEQGKRLFAIYLLAVNAGLRTVEISRANIKDLETKGGRTWLYIWGKGHTEPDQKKALAPEVAAALREYLQSRSDRPTGTSPLFVSTGNRSGGRRIAPTTISTMLKQAMQAAGYDSERLTAHSLRHTAGTSTYNVTRNIYETQAYMRHDNPATTEIYMHIDNEEHEAEIASNLYAYYHQQEV